MKQSIKNVVLVHGAFADGSVWEAVANILKNDGYKVSVAQPPETSYADDPKVHQGGNRQHRRASGSGRPQLRRVHHHRGRQSSKRSGACLYCRICPRRR